MDSKIRNRVLEMANMILENNTTVRDVAKRIGYSKSTEHKDLREKLPLINEELYEKVCELLAFNKKVRHIRGGQSTKIHYALLKFPPLEFPKKKDLSDHLSNL